MKCPHCNIGIKVDWENSVAHLDNDNFSFGTEVATSMCPDCGKLIVKLIYGHVVHPSEYTSTINQIVGRR